MYKKQPSTSDSLIYETSRKTFFLERRNYGIEMKHNVFLLSELQPQHEICSSK